MTVIALTQGAAPDSGRRGSPYPPEVFRLRWRRRNRATASAPAPTAAPPRSPTRSGSGPGTGGPGPGRVTVTERAAVAMLPDVSVARAEIVVGPFGGGGGP